MAPLSVVVAPDKFKHSLTAQEVADVVADAVRSVHPTATVVTHPVADGGEGTVDLMLRHGFTPVVCRAQGPSGADVSATYALGGGTAVIEMAAVAGLHLVAGGPTPVTALASSTYGVGQLVRDALDHGAERIVLGLGGSASTDGGAGLLLALGAHVLDATGRQVPPGGGGLLSAHLLDLGQLDPRLARTEIVVAADVSNPLTGPDGASWVFAAQKGADHSTTALLDEALARWADLLAGHTTDLRWAAGAGAAGGTAFPLLALAGARFVPGIDHVLDLTGFDALAAAADLVVVGEGSLDRQSLLGKGPVGVARRARRLGARVVAVVGRSALEEGQASGAGLAEVHALADLEPDPEVCIRDAARLLTELVRRAAARWETAPTPRVQPPSPQEWREAVLGTVSSSTPTHDW